MESSRNIKATGNAVSGRMWCFTLPADEKEGEHIKWPLATRDLPPIHWASHYAFRYMKYQVEKAPSTGKIHLQGFICLKRALRLSQMKNAYSQRAHWEKSRGTIEDNDNYVSKQDTKVCGPFELGTRPEGGTSKTRARWETVKEMVKDGSNRNQILMDMPELAPQVRGIDALIEAFKPAPEISREITVFYIYGTTGVGKTHHALKQFPDAFLLRGKYQEGKSFDMYQGEKTLILDEWSPYEWPLTLMNSILDKWKCPLICRYSNKYAMWTTVVITTNAKFEDCYTACLPAQKASFERRLTYKMELTERVDVIHWEAQPGSPDITEPVTPTTTSGDQICPECKSFITPGEGCGICESCGWSKCSKV